VLPLPPPSWESWTTPPFVVAEIDRLLDRHTYPQIAAILNERGLRSGKGRRFTARCVARLQRAYHLKPRYDRLRAAGMLTLDEMARALGVHPQTVKTWHAHGLLRAHAYTDKPEWLYEPPGENGPRKAQGVKLSKRTPPGVILTLRPKEVQCEA